MKIGFRCVLRLCVVQSAITSHLFMRRLDFPYNKQTHFFVHNIKPQPNSDFPDPSRTSEQLPGRSGLRPDGPGCFPDGPAPTAEPSVILGLNPDGLGYIPDGPGYGWTICPDGPT